MPEVLRLFQNAAVEDEPGQFAIDEALGTGRQIRGRLTCPRGFARRFNSRPFISKNKGLSGFGHVIYELYMTANIGRTS